MVHLYIAWHIYKRELTRTWTLNKIIFSQYKQQLTSRLLINTNQTNQGWTFGTFEISKYKQKPSGCPRHIFVIFPRQGLDFPTSYVVLYCLLWKWSEKSRSWLGTDSEKWRSSVFLFSMSWHEKRLFVLLILVDLLTITV